ncbi:uncharacterized protein VTP21DRAFT_3946 [Calcarisporiella thermophila]|uniref:uncharacterized protein n=1 Tax=Calcarisporiella thermophila TaxID=911321 RepID=UPI003742E04B
MSRPNRAKESRGLAQPTLFSLAHYPCLATGLDDHPLASASKGSQMSSSIEIAPCHEEMAVIIVCGIRTPDYIKSDFLCTGAPRYPVLRIERRAIRHPLLLHGTLLVTHTRLRPAVNLVLVIEVTSMARTAALSLATLLALDCKEKSGVLALITWAFPGYRRLSNGLTSIPLP